MLMVLASLVHRSKYFFKQSFYYLFAFWVILFLSLGWQGIESLLRAMTPSAAASNYTYIENFSTDAQRGDDTTGSWGGDGIATVGRGQEFNWANIHLPDATGRMFFSPTYDSTACAGTPSAVCTYAILRTSQPPIWTPDNGQNFYELLPPSLAAQSYLTESFGIDMAYSPDFATDGNVFIAISGSMLAGGVSELYQAELDIMTGGVDFESTPILNAVDGSVQGVAVSPHLNLASCPSATTGACVIYAAQNGQGIVRLEWDGLSWSAQTISGPDTEYTAPSDQPDSRTLGSILLAVEDPDDTTNHIVYYVADATEGGDTTSVFKLDNALLDPDSEGPDPYELCGVGTACNVVALPVLTGSKDITDGVTSKPLGVIEGSIALSPDYATNRTVYWATSTSEIVEGEWLGGMARYVDNGSSNWETVFSLNDVATATGGRVAFSLYSGGVLRGTSSDKLVISYVVAANLSGSDAQWPYGINETHTLFSVSDDAGVTWSSPASLTGSGISADEISWATFGSMSVVPGGANAWSDIYIYDMFMNRMYFSGDGGVTWVIADNLDAPARVLDVQTTNSGVVFVTYSGNNQVYRSRDFGQTFTRLPPAGQVSDLADCSAVSGDQLGFAPKWGVWTHIDPSPNFDSDDTVYATLLNGYVGVLYTPEVSEEINTCTGSRLIKSEDGGDTWELVLNPVNVENHVNDNGVPVPFAGFSDIALTQDYDGGVSNCDDTLACTLFGLVSGLSVWRSDNHGATWTEVLDPDDIIAFGDGFVENGNVFTAIRLAPRFTNETGVIVLTALASTGIVYSADGGENFQAIVPGDVGLSSIDSIGFPSDFDNANAGNGGCDEGDANEFLGSCDVLLGGIVIVGESGETSIVKLDNGFFDAGGNIGFSPANPVPVQQGDLLGPPSVILGDHDSEFFAGVGKIDSWAYPPFAAPTISFSSASNTSRFFKVDPVDGDIVPRDDGGDDGAALPGAGDHITTGVMLGETIGSGIILGANGLWRSYVYDVVGGTEIVSKNLSIAASNIRRVTLTPTQYVPAGASVSYALSNNSCEIDSDDFVSDFEGGAGTYTGPIGEPGAYTQSDPITMIFPRGGSGLCFKIMFSGMTSDGPMPAVTQIAFEYGNTPPLTPQGVSFNSENRTLAVTTVEDNDRGDKYWLQFEIRPMSGGRVTRFDQSLSAYGWGSASYQVSSYAGDPPIAGEPAMFTLPDAYMFSPGAQYEWRVRAKDVGGAFSPYTPWDDFTASDGFTEDFTSLSNLSTNQALYDGIQPLRIDTASGVAKFNDSVSFEALVNIGGLGGGDVVRMVPLDPNMDGRMDVVVVRSSPQNYGTEFHASHTILYTNTTMGGSVSFTPELDLTYEIFQSGYEQGENAPTAFFQTAGKDVVGGILVDSTIAGFGLERADNGSIEVGQITPLPFVCVDKQIDGFAADYIDGDGVYDIVATCGDGGDVLLYSSEKILSTGDFANMIQVVDEDVAVAAMELLDVDGDGDTDIVVLTHEDDVASGGIVYANDGSGNFESTAFNLTSGVSNVVNLQESVLFSSYGVRALSYTSTDASAGFLIIGQNNNGDVTVSQQSLEQTISAQPDDLNGICGFVEADFGGDGDMDFVVVAGTNTGSPYCQGSDVVAGAMLLTNELQVQDANLYTIIPGLATNPSFTDAEDVPKNISSVLAFDVDGDGRKDILAAEYGGSIGLYAQTENSTFVSDDIENHGAFAQSTIPFALWGYSTYLGAMHPASQVIQSIGSMNGYQNKGNGFFSRDIELPDFDQQYATEDFKVALPVDMNKDGYLDYYLFSFPPNDPTTPVIALSDGAEGFAYHSLTISVAAPFPVVGDINGDGLIDVIYTAGFECDSSGACGAEVFYGEQDGFSEASEFEVYIKGGDQNGDQLNFEDRTTGGIGLRTSQLVDVDGDGDLDMVVFMDRPGISGESGEWWEESPYSWVSNRGYAVLKNRGDGVFDAFISLVDDNALNSSSALADGASGFNEAETVCSPEYPDVVQASTLTAYDMDNDGDYDIVGSTEPNVGCSSDASLPFVAWNKGNGVFDIMKLFWSVGGDMPSGSVKVFDMDGDGYPDIVYSLNPTDNGGSLDVWIGWNTGDRSFSLQRIDTGFPATMIASGFVGDIDGDGDGDMVFADSDTETPQHQVLRFSASHSVIRELRVVSKAFNTGNTRPISSLVLRIWHLVMPNREDALSVRVSTINGGDDADAYEWVDPEEDGTSCSEVMNYCDYLFNIPSGKQGDSIVWDITVNTEASAGQSPVIYRVDVPQYSVVNSSGGGGIITIAPLQVFVSPSMAHVGSSTRAHGLVWKIVSTRSLNAGQQRLVLLDEGGSQIDYEWVGAESCSPQDGEMVCVSYVKEVSTDGRIKPDTLYRRILRVEVEMGGEEATVLAQSSLSDPLRSLADPVAVVMDSAARERPLRARTDRGDNGEGVKYAVFIGGNTEKSGWLALSGKIIPAQLCSHESRGCDVPDDAVVETKDLGNVPFYVLNDSDWSYEITVIAINQDGVVSVGNPARVPALNGPVLEVRKSAHALAFVGATVQKMARMMGAMIIPTAHASAESGLAVSSSQGSIMAMAYDFTQTLRVMSAFTVPLIVLGVLLVIGAVYLVLQMHEHKKRTARIILGEFLSLLRNGAQKNFEHSVPRGVSGTFKFAYSDYKRRHDRLRLSVQAFMSVVLAKILTLALLATMGHVLPHGALASPQIVSSVTQGDSVRYVVEVSNTGNKTATGVVLTDTIPEGAAYVSGTATAKINDQAETTVANNGEGQSISFDVGSIQPGQTVFVAYTVKVREDALGDLTNEVSVAYGEQNATTKNTIAARPNIKNPIIPPEPPVTPPPVPPVSPPETSTGGAGLSGQDAEDGKRVIIEDVRVSYGSNNVLLTIKGTTPEAGGVVEFVITPQSSVFNLIPTAHASEVQFPVVLTYTPQDLQWEFTTEVVLSRGGYQIFAYLIKPSGDRSPASTAKSFRVEYMSSAQALADNFNTLASFNPGEVIASPRFQKVNQAYVAPLLFAVAILNASWAVNLYNLLNLFQQFITQPALLLERRKRKGWGIVYNALTKFPVDLAVVRLHDAKTGRLLQTRITDKHGRYAFLVEPGEYRILVTKVGYKFPSLFAKGKAIDVDYIGIYQGRDILAPSPMTITLNIPFDPEERVEEPREVLMRVELRRLQSAFSVFGMVCALGSFMISPNVFVGGLLVGHVLLYGVFRRLAITKSPKSWGVVTDAQTKKPLTQTIVRIFDMQFNKLLESQVTDSRGRYGFLVGKNTYYATYEHEGYVKERGPVIDTTKSKAGDQLMVHDIALKKSHS